MDAAKDQSPRVRQVPVCAIGASAGGVKALQHFFRGIRDDLGLAYVVIVHLSPEHESQLSEILAGRTRMPVRQVVDSPELEPNCVYVIPPDRELVIEDNAIRARPFSEPRGQRAPIDMFFRSIAAGRGDGMAVILSGAGSDGALGVRKVKEAGGVIFVQEPSEAEFGMMPRSAMATGVADFVEPIDRMVERIAEVARSKEALRRLGDRRGRRGPPPHPRLPARPRRPRLLGLQARDRPAPRRPAHGGDADAEPRRLCRRTSARTRRRRRTCSATC